MQKKNNYIRIISLMLAFVLFANNTVWASDVEDYLLTENMSEGVTDIYLENTAEFTEDIADEEIYEDNYIIDDYEDYGIIEDEFLEETEDSFEESISESYLEESSGDFLIEEESATESTVNHEIPVVDYEIPLEETCKSGNADDAHITYGSTAKSRRLFSGNGNISSRYGDQLSGTSKEIYDYLVSTWCNGNTDTIYHDFLMDETFSFEPIMTEESGTPSWVGKDNDANYKETYPVAIYKAAEYIQAATDALKYDYPSLFWLDNVNFGINNPSTSQIYNEDTGVHTFWFNTITIIKPNEMVKNQSKQLISYYNDSLAQAVSEINASFDSNTSLAKKIKIIHNYITDNAIYSDSTYAHTAYSILGGNGYAVCDGYSKAFKALCDEFGIECMLIPGIVNSIGETHGWNYVRLDDGLWYVVDATWDDSSRKYDYLLAGGNTIGHYGTSIKKERTIMTAFSTPEAYDAYNFSIPETADEMYHEYEYIDAENPCDGELYCDIHEEYKIDTINEIKDYVDSSCEEDGSYRIVKRCSVCGREISSQEMVVDAKGHTFGNMVYENVVDSTCTSKGSRDVVRYCTTCQKELSRSTETFDALGHEWDEGTVTKKATCTEDGIKTYTCKHDATHTKTEVIKATGHEESVPVIENNTGADCENAGSYDSVVYCKKCNAELSRTHFEEGALGHSWNDGEVIKKVSCTQDGTIKYTCTRNPEHTKTEPIKAPGHTPGEVVIENNIPETCENDGSFDNVVYCTVCNEEISREHVVVNAKAHEPKEAVVENNINPSCETDGSCDKVIYCNNCNKELSRETITVPKTGHIKNEPVIENMKAPSCEEDGSYDSVVYCETCNKELSRENVVIPKTGHIKKEAVIENKKDATCEESGSYDSVIYCETCNKELSREAITIKPTGHEWDSGVVTEDSNCEKEGSILYTCKHDSSHTKTEPIAKKAHSPGTTQKENVVDATCEKEGSYDNVIYCTNCNQEISRETTTVKAIGHKWGSGVITKKASCSEEGVFTYTCKNDPAHIKTENIPKTEHVAGNTVIENNKSATCENDGSYDEVKYCKNCGAEISRKTISVKATGHNWDNGVVTKAAGCETAGIKTYTCKNNPSHKKTEEISATGHTFGEWTTTKQPTALSKGIMTCTCSKCSKTKQKEIDTLTPYIKLNATSFPIKVKQSTTGLKVIAMQSGDYIDKWESSNSKIVTVSQSGKIKGKKVGKAKITVTLKSGVSASCTVKVQKPAVKTSKISITVNEETIKSYSLEKGESVKLTSVITPFTSKDKVKYSSSKKTVVTVSGKGVVKAKKKGTAYITAKSGKKTVKIKISVK